MLKQATLVGMLLMFCWLPLSQRRAAAQNEVELYWSEIAPLILGQEIAVVLPDTTQLRGKPLAVRADAMELDIKQTSDRRLHPKGKTTIPRSSISAVELRKMRKFRIGTIAGGVAGVLGGAFVGALAGAGIGEIAGNGTDAVLGGMLGAVAGMGPGAIVGGRVGRKYDRRSTLIRILPEAPDTAKPPEPAQTGSEVMELDDSGFSGSNLRSKPASDMWPVTTERWSRENWAF
ncbi:MAG: hypothetical protein HY316_08400 [Acidobacteria bacterium]|nr:hypothetical protein [Acidobacteriota bacterium]